MSSLFTFQTCFTWFRSLIRCLVLIGAVFGVSYGQTAQNSPSTQVSVSGHTRGVSAVAFSADRQRLMTASDDQTIKIWECSTGKLLFTLTGHSSGVKALAVIPQSNFFVSGGLDGNLNIWNLHTGVLVQTLAQGQGIITSLAVFPDGTRLVVGISRQGSGGRWRGVVQQWNLQTSSLLFQWEFKNSNSWLESLALSPDGKTLATGSDDKLVQLWDSSTGTLKAALTGHTQSVTGVAFSPDGKTLASSSSNESEVRLWDVGTGTLKRTLSNPGKTIFSDSKVSFSPDGQKLVLAADQKLTLWNLATGTVVHQFTSHTDTIKSIVFSQDGTLLASSSRDQSIRLWEVSTGKLYQTIPGSTVPVFGVAISKSGKLGASVCKDGLVRLWKPETGEVVTVLNGNGHPAHAVAFTPNDTLVVSAQSLQLWNTSSFQLVRSFGETAGAVLAVAPSGEWIATGGSTFLDPSQKPAKVEDSNPLGNITLWSLKDGKRIQTFAANAVPLAAAFSPNGKKLVVAYHFNPLSEKDKPSETIQVWDCQSGKSLLSFKSNQENLTSMALSPDGKCLATSGRGNQIELWDVSTGHQIKLLTATSRWAEWVAFSPDGQTLASPSNYGKIDLWDVQRGVVRKSLVNSIGTIASMTFSPDGKNLVAGGFLFTEHGYGPGCTALWEVSSGKILWILP